MRSTHMVIMTDTTKVPFNGIISPQVAGLSHLIDALGIASHIEPQELDLGSIQTLEVIGRTMVERETQVIVVVGFEGMDDKAEFQASFEAFRALLQADQQLQSLTLLAFWMRPAKEDQDPWLFASLVPQVEGLVYNTILVECVRRICAVHNNFPTIMARLEPFGVEETAVRDALNRLVGTVLTQNRTRHTYHMVNCPNSEVGWGPA